MFEEILRELEVSGDLATPEDFVGIGEVFHKVVYLNLTDFNKDSLSQAIRTLSNELKYHYTDKGRKFMFIDYYKFVKEDLQLVPADTCGVIVKYVVESE